MRSKSDKRTIEYVGTSSLTPYARNSRTHAPEQVKQIAASIREFGFTNPVLIDDEGTIIAGHGRVLAAQHLQLAEVPCIRLGYLTETQRRAYVIADNKLALNAGWDEELLKLELEDLHLDNFDLGKIGFDAKELSEAMGLDDKEVVEDEVPEPPVDPITKPGDLWLLGEHRLLCGDSTKAEDVERLMAGAKADLCFTSPPYALGKSVALSGNKKMAAKANAYDDHEDNAAEWAGLMSSWFSASDTAVSDVWVVNVQPLAGNKRDLVRFIADNAGRLVDVATWDKGHAAPQMAAGVMASRYEWMIIFAASDGASRAVPLSSWQGTVQSVYVAPPQRGNEFSDIHAATMPLHVPSWVMQTLCDQSKSVYEPFCGTGTTLIAAEQLGRKCYGMEISPQYCDVIVKRWETFTGRKAELVNG
jgi:hypothetical protein